MASRALIRRLHVTPAPVVSPGHAAPAAEVPPLPVLHTVDQIRVQALGLPPSAASVSVPPSVPVHVRRNTLLSVQGSWSTISSSTTAPDWLKRWAYGLHMARYQRLVGTSAFSLLVTANKPAAVPALWRNITSRSFAALELDGRTDWAVLPGDALHVYGGPALHVGLYAVPARILRRLARIVGSARAATGLAHWMRRGYTFVSGRGVVALAGHGLVYAAQIAEDEELTVRRENLVAVSVNGPHDLQNCVVQHRPTQRPAAPAPPRMERVSSWADVVINAKFYWWRIAKMFRADAGFVGAGFVRVFGPRTVLLQSGHARQQYERAVPREQLLETESAPPQATPADYLNVVTFDQTGAPSIRSTADFKDAVRAVEKRNP